MSSPALQPAKVLNIHTLTPPLNPVVITDGAGLDRVRSYLSRVTAYAMDYETNIVPTIFHRRARTLQLGDRNEQYIIDMMALADGKENLIRDQGFYGRSKAPWLRALTEVVRPSFESRTHLKIGHRLQFEYEVSKWCLGLRPWNFYDTNLAENVLYTGLHDFFETGFWGMEDLSRRYFGMEIEKGVQKQDWLKEEPLNDIDIAYCALDCRVPTAIRDMQLVKLEKAGLLFTVQIENDAIPAFGDMKINGFYLHPESWRELEADNRRELKEAVASMDEIFIPVVGKNEPPIIEHRLAALKPALDAAEAEWRVLGNKSEREKELGVELRRYKSDCPEKKAIKDERAALEAERTEKKKVAQEAYKKLSTEYKAIAKLPKQYEEASAKWEGTAAINYNSPDQLYAALMKGKFGLNEKNLKATKDKFLERHAEKPVIKAIRKYRRYKKLADTYGENWLRLTTEENPKRKGSFGYTDPDTGRVHSDINQLGADTGRTSSSSPNLQNIPKEDKYRACFRCRLELWKMLTIDYNGQELRIMTEGSHEPAWIKAFSQGWDVHSFCAEILYHKKWEAATVTEPYEVNRKGQMVTIPKCAYYFPSEKHPTGHQKCSCPGHEEMRGWLKAVNFGIAYGKQARALAADLEISVEEAEALLALYKRMFPVLWAWLEKNGQLAIDSLESRTMSGRRRQYKRISFEYAKFMAPKKDWVKEQMAADKRTEPTDSEIRKVYQALNAGLRNQGMNTPVQGTGADMVKLALGCGFDDDGKPFAWHIMEPEFSYLLENAVHDETVGECPDHPDAQEVSPFYTGPGIQEGNAKLAFAAMVDCMSRAGTHFIKSIPVTAEGHVDVRWRK
jgi:DNA polymerase I-like protein with 3'-5' exonuclease and polymerase domains